MRFIGRAIIGFVILASTLAMIGFGGWRVWTAIEAQKLAKGRVGAPEERSFVVGVDRLTRREAIPIIEAYGEIASWRTLELRSSAAGHLVQIAPVFREGAAVERGALLFAIDQADPQSELDRAEIALAEAKAELAEAERAVGLAEKELAAAATQRDLRARALERQESLKSRGVGTESAVEDAALALSAAEQGLIGREQSLAQSLDRIERAKIALRRQAIAVADAGRKLAETRVTAPFDGVLGEVNAVLGRLVNANEKLGVLIDPAALEVAFRLTGSQFARLVGEDGTLGAIPVTVTLALNDAPITISGVVERAGATVGEGQTGRLVYARLKTEADTVLRPGDFVTVEIAEPALADVAVIPAAAATEDGRILLLTEDERLEEAATRILRRQGDALIVADAPFGRDYVIERLPQLGPGVRVRPVRPAAGGDEGAQTVTLDPERRARLIAFVERDGVMPEEAKRRILGNLAKDEAPKALVERLEARMGG
jgi:hypothetical protein